MANAAASPGMDARIGDLLARVGERVRRARAERRWSRRELAETSRVSQRHLAQLESGHGNISIVLLARIADALGTSLESLVAEGAIRTDKARRIALIGLRGAGKSTLGRAAAERLGIAFLETNDVIAAAAGMPVGEVIALYGQEGYRHLERQALQQIAKERDCALVAVAGGIVTEPDAYAYLRARFHTIWLRAAPEEHMTRVRGQGDERPMTGTPDAFGELQRILAGRETLYAQADMQLDTSGALPAESVAALLAEIERQGLLGK